MQNVHAVEVLYKDLTGFTKRGLSFDEAETLFSELRKTPYIILRSYRDDQQGRKEIM